MEDYDGITGGLGCIVVGFFLLLPLGIWKLIDIIIWLFQHVKIVD